MLSPVFGEGSHLFPQTRGSRQILTTLQKASELYFVNDTLQQINVNIPEANYWVSACERGIRCPLKCLPSDWLSPSPFRILNPWFRLPSVTPLTKDQGAGHLQRTGLYSGGWVKETALGNPSDVKVGFLQV